ncbi:NAD-dependent epimerase/dehydratase family protein [Actinoplanes lutulentus]|uniref:NAD-dependent epimerase/dehydratase family protein n=2 Tax=Actinoplanes lutulentus TaxID=1287878 RepID=A0A327Z560_9ACTN|nr:NAD-dependent epimerase/dehydratase family protein [Actinoplanes lutulentus]
MGDSGLVRSLAATHQAVINVAAPGAEVEASFADAVLDAGPEVFIRTGGVWVHGAGDAITEETPLDAPALVAWREKVDQRALAAPGIRSVLIEPGIVYGHGGGIARLVVGASRTDEGLTLIGDGTQHWATVHVDDLAELYVLALEKAPAGSTFIGVSGVNPTVRELGEAASSRLGLGGRVVAEDPAATVARLGDFGAALLVSQQATGEKARRVLGWAPSRASLVEEIAAGGY